MRTGFVGIIGRPNVGKSTLLNRVLGEKISITTDKPQTTRNVIRGIYTRRDQDDPAGGTQIVFMDTPGIHRPRNKLGEYMTDAALSTLREVDAILFLIDGTQPDGPGDAFVLEKIKESGTPAILVINKIDMTGPDRFKELFDRYTDMGVFRTVLGISALDGTNVEEVTAAAEELMPEGPIYFPEDMITDHPERFVVSEIIREKTLLYMEDEVPHGVAVEIVQFKEGPRITEISAVIYCEKKSHKGMIIGAGGRKLKGIGKSAREEIEALIGQKVYLELWVKVKENWRDSDFVLSNFGYKNEN